MMRLRRGKCLAWGLDADRHLGQQHAAFGYRLLQGAVFFGIDRVDSDRPRSYA
jgi:hypothetical protein